MAIDWEGLLGASGSRLQRAYDDRVQEASEKIDELYGLDNAEFSASTFVDEFPFGDPSYDDFHDIDEPEDEDEP